MPTPHSQYDRIQTSAGLWVPGNGLSAVTVLVLNVPDGAMGTVQVDVNGRASPDVCFCGEGKIAVSRPPGGVAVAKSALPLVLSLINKDLGAALWSATADVVGNQVRIRATGAADWWGAMEVYWGAVTT